MAIAWIRRGFPLLDHFEYLLKDENVALEISEHNWPEFFRVGVSFRSNREFMRRALDLDGRVLQWAAPAIQNDLEFHTRALASHPGALEPSNLCDRKLELNLYVKKKLDLHHVFLHDFLRGIAIATPHVAPLRRSHLSMLNIGVETSEAFKWLIAKYLGVPMGEELRLLRKALRHMEVAGKTSPGRGLHGRMSYRRQMLWRQVLGPDEFRQHIQLAAMNNRNIDFEEDIGIAL
jgi:hypothetical protein